MESKPKTISGEAYSADKIFTDDEYFERVKSLSPTFLEQGIQRYELDVEWLREELAHNKKKEAYYDAVLERMGRDGARNELIPRLVSKAAEERTLSELKLNKAETFLLQRKNVLERIMHY